MGFETSDLISSFEASFSSFLSGNGFGTALSISNWLSLRLAVPEVLSFSILTSLKLNPIRCLADWSDSEHVSTIWE
uniref:Uncharacterized protein MANES_09G088900 n=1 Tax=Rhizophora mucronata TaxID=61149 RepID=A0A2P2ME73_RHIMU